MLTCEEAKILFINAKKTMHIEAIGTALESSVRNGEYGCKYRCSPFLTVKQKKDILETFNKLGFNVAYYYYKDSEKDSSSRRANFDDKPTLAEDQLNIEVAIPAGQFSGNEW